MSMSLQEEQAPIFKRIASALVEATPEWWSSATLELSVRETLEGVDIAHCISNAEFPRDFVTPTDELSSATRELVLASQRHQDGWKRCLFRVTQEGDAWRFVAEFER
jgi:hypothetical protein